MDNKLFSASSGQGSIELLQDSTLMEFKELSTECKIESPELSKKSSSHKDQLSSRLFISNTNFMICEYDLNKSHGHCIPFLFN